MTIGGWIFMTVSVTSVLVLTFWCYARLLKGPE